MIIFMDSLIDVVCTYYCVARVTCLVILITAPYKTLPVIFDLARFLTLCISMQRNKSDQTKHGLHVFLLKYTRLRSTIISGDAAVASLVQITIFKLAAANVTLNIA